MNFEVQLSLECGCLIEPKVVMLKFQYQLTMKVSDMIGQYVYLLPNWVIVALTLNIRIFDVECSRYTRRTRIWISENSSNPNPGSRGRIFDLPFTESVVSDDDMHVALRCLVDERT